MKKIETLANFPHDLFMFRGVRAHARVTFSDFEDCGELAFKKAKKVEVFFYSIEREITGYLTDHQIPVTATKELEVMTISGPIEYVEDVIETLGIVP